VRVFRVHVHIYFACRGKAIGCSVVINIAGLSSVSGVPAPDTGGIPLHRLLSHTSCKGNSPENDLCTIYASCSKS
jgi:hypothetical protein